MLESPILTVAFIVVIVSFFKKQFALTGKWPLVAAFITALVLALVPVFVTAFPVSAPWLNAIVNVVVLFLSAAGSFDLIMEVRTAA